jgi:hypothetical protein
VGRYSSTDGERQLDRQDADTRLDPEIPRPAVVLRVTTRD